MNDIQPTETSTIHPHPVRCLDKLAKSPGIFYCEAKVGGAIYRPSIKCPSAPSLSIEMCARIMPALFELARSMNNFTSYPDDRFVGPRIEEAFSVYLGNLRACVATGLRPISDEGFYRKPATLVVITEKCDPVNKSLARMVRRAIGRIGENW